MEPTSVHIEGVDEASAKGSSADAVFTGGTVASVAVLAALVGFGTPDSHTYRAGNSHIRNGSGDDDGEGGGPQQWQQWLTVQPDGARLRNGLGSGRQAASGGGMVRSAWERQLLSRLLPHDSSKLTIDDLSSTAISMWVTDPAVLSRCAYEVAQATFRRTKDPLGEVALLHLACGRRDLLKNLAVASSNNPGGGGQKLGKLLGITTGTGARARKAAHKNAFVLLSKSQFYMAAATFLCSTPPFVREAADVILTRMRNPSLALLITRLVEQVAMPTSAASAKAKASGGLGMMMMGGGMGGGLGGGGGGGAASPEVIERRIGRHTKNLLRKRLVPYYREERGETSQYGGPHNRGSHMTCGCLGGPIATTDALSHHLRTHCHLPCSILIHLHPSHPHNLSNSHRHWRDLE